jgi:tetratricopeptide (TPR) repeat protein
MHPSLWLVFAVLALAPAGLRAQPSPGPDPFELRAGAWDRSVHLERQGRLQEALAVLHRGWGEAPESYEVTVRSAWLNLRLGRADKAAQAYRRARMLRGAGPEASTGLASALAELGHEQLQDNLSSEAEAQFKQAAALDPENQRARDGLRALSRLPTLQPELWGAYVRRSGQGPSWNGVAVFAQLPWNVTGALTLRGAFRHITLGRQLGNDARGPGRQSSINESWSQNEAYAGLGYERKWFGLEAMGIGLFPSDEKAAWAGAGRVRAGHSLGVNVEAAALRPESGWSGQLLPTAFWWPSPSVGLATGPRLTFGPQGTDASLTAGLTGRFNSASLFLSGHYGVERSPVTISVPSVLTLAQELKYGASVASVFSVTETVKLGLQAQVERIALAGAEGTFATVSAGILLAPRF